mmetsp:Transcript_15193/g.28830  ORF Transcript_15193/g.28830 Transcript_15193/m.28830 type:complete len:327 (+) Transcript_15193:135-1115(+)
MAVLQRQFSDPSNPDRKWFAGLVMASLFSLVYFIAPFYMITAIFVLLFNYPNRLLAWLYVTPLFASALVPSMASPWLLGLLTPMADYFDYEEIHETSPRDVWTEVREGKSNFLVVKQPHGVLSYTGMMSAIMAPPEIRGVVKTAVADALLVTPILKHVMGIFGLISASKKNLIQTFQKKGAEGTVVLYVGGMAELFLSCEQEEKLYLKKRKGFIKLALTQGIDIVPVYLFGNTSVLSVLKTGLLATISRKLQVSLTYVWGRWNLPIPREVKLLYVTGQPLGLPKIEKPTQQDIDKYHQQYCDQVTRLYEKYKEKIPEYKHKKLIIV